MIEKALSWIEERCKPSFFGGEEVLSNLIYTDKQVLLVKPPEPKPIEIGTLTGLVDYIKTNLDQLDQKNIMALILGPTCVHLIGPLSRPHFNRNLYLKAQCKSIFDNSARYMPLENFIVYMQTAFVRNETVSQLLKIVGNIKDENVVNFNDDGVTQQVTAKTGIVRVENVAVPNPVTLAPFRTFPEIEQPESVFVFRMRGGKGSPPECMLSAADGDGWQMAAVAKIKAYLVEKLPEVVVIA